VFSVDKVAYDRFFNSPFGIRAQYCRDPKLGGVRNRQCIDALFERLMATAQVTGPGVSLDQVAASLRCGSSKIWIDEHAQDCTLKHTIAVSDLVTVDVPRWVRAAEEAEAEIRAFQRARPRVKDRALYGIQAPEGTTLKVLGGFLCETSSKEFVVPSKRRRHQQIQLYGFS
jgi:hypothetical protein